MDLARGELEPPPRVFSARIGFAERFATSEKGSVKEAARLELSEVIESNGEAGAKCVENEPTSFDGAPDQARFYVFGSVHMAILASFQGFTRSAAAFVLPEFIWAAQTGPKQCVTARA